MSTPDLITLRADLETEQADLTRQLSELTADGNAAGLDENFADAAQITAEQVENRSLAATLQDQLSDVEGALSRIDDGTYGICQVCENPVSPARLEAMPSTRFCIDHA